MKISFDSPVGKSLGQKGFTGPRLGIELEYEKTSGPPEAESTFWRVEGDHSLRKGGLEFISTPLRPDNLKRAILSMVKAAKLVKAQATPRCGLHVHLNATHLSWRELYKWVTYYALVEPYLFADFCPGREDSHFCVPTWSNTALTEYMYADGQKLRNGINIPELKTGAWSKASQYLNGNAGKQHRLMMIHTPKYAALNMSSLKKFGTLEFRQAPSSLSPKFIENWAQILLDIQRVALTYREPSDIVRMYEKLGARAMCADVGFLPKKIVHELDKEDAADAATIIAGHIPVDWHELDWEVG